MADTHAVATRAAESRGTATRKLVDEQADDLLVSRIRVALWLILGSTFMLPLAELLRASTGMPTLEVLLVQAVVVVVVLLRLPRQEPQAIAKTLLTLAIVSSAVALIGLISADVITPSILLLLLTLVSATLIPWGVRAQSVAVLVAALAWIATLHLVPSGTLALGSPAAFAEGFAFVLSIYITFDVQRTRASGERRDRDRQRTEEALRLVESAVEQANEAIVIMTPDLDWPGPRIVYVNPAFTAMTGFSAEETAGQTLKVLFGPGTEADVITKVRDALSKAEPSLGEGVFHRKDGSAYILEWHTAPVRDASGAITNWVTINRDITARKRADEEKAAMLEVARDISGQLDLNEILERVQRRTAALLPCDRVATFSWDAHAGSFRLMAQYGFTTGQLPADAPAELRPRPLLLDVLLHGETVIVDDPRGQQWVPAELLEGLGLVAVLGAPLLVRGHLLGLLAAASTARQRRFEPVQVQLFEAIAHQVAVASEAAELYRLQQEEAKVSSTLAQVGEEMISSLSAPVLLARLCQLTTEMLGCDCSHTFLWKPEESAYVPVFGYGDLPEQWESIRLLRIPPGAITGLLARLKAEEVVQLIGPQANEDAAMRSLAQFGLTANMCVGLRRGDELIGYYAAHYRGRAQPFTPSQERIAHGIAHLASMALENARLVEELERANRIKSEFVATMSHELRTPLNVVIGYNELLLDDVFGALTAEQKDPLRRADRASRELLDLINATLSLSRFDQRRMPLEIEEVHVSDLVDEVTRETPAVREKPQLTFECHVPADLPPMSTDPVKLKMVLKNLISNAFKFTHEGAVTVSVAGLDGGVEFRVSDTGIGIAPAEQALIFEPFRQVDSSDTRRYGGAGLGLYIVHRLLDLLAGTIAVESEVGKGSTFRVWVPRDVRSVSPTVRLAIDS